MTRKHDALIGCQLMGGLGNQLFQIAAAYSLAKKNGYTLLFSETITHAPDRLPVWNTYLDPSYWNIIPNSEYYNILWTVLPEPKWTYTPFPSLKDSIQRPYILIGYFQSSRYFDEYKNEIRRMFKPSYHLMLESHTLLQENHIEAPEEWIGAHVRRGDYVTVKDSQIFLVCGPDYYKRSRATIDEKLGGQKRRVCWITDDMEWVKENITETGDIVLSNKNPYIDFTSLTQFKHMILSNSSFSWWACWLNPNQYEERVICCPNKWFGPDPSSPTEYETIYESEWVRIDTTSGNVATHDSNHVIGSSAGH